MLTVSYIENTAIGPRWAQYRSPENLSQHSDSDAYQAASADILFPVIYTQTLTEHHRTFKTDKEQRASSCQRR